MKTKNLIQPILYFFVSTVLVASGCGKGDPISSDYEVDDRYGQDPVVIINPSQGARLAGTIFVQIDAADGLDIDRIEFHVDGELLATVYERPYQLGWDTSGQENGQHRISAVGHGSNGRSWSSGSFHVTVANYYGKDPVDPKR